MRAGLFSTCSVSAKRIAAESNLQIDWRALVAAILAALVLTACGGKTEETATSQEEEGPFVALTTEAEAARFLAQASFGASDSSIRDVQRYGYEGSE